MWIVRLALRRPYTFVVMAMAIILLGLVAILRMPTDIFPEVDIPVISVIWQYPGMSPNEMEGRIVRLYEGILTTTVNNIEHIESQPPLPLRKQLADEAWVAARRQEIEARTAQFEAHCAALDTALQALLKSPDHGKKFGPN